MSIEYLDTLRWAISRYGFFLGQSTIDDKMSQEAKDHSICFELYLLLERKLTPLMMLKSKKEKSVNNRTLKIKVHMGMVVLDALHHVRAERDFRQVPAMEHIKEQISKQIL